MSTLFSGLKAGQMALPHRIVMSPMTRSRAATPGNVPTALMAEYYAQRASAAFIITEATQVSAQAQGYAWTPGIHSEDQIEAWKKITDAVHAKGGKIVVQLWHTGRISHRTLQPDQSTPVAPSEVRPEGNAFTLDANGVPAFLPFETPRALTTDEMQVIVGDFADAAQNAMRAGFDGVEVHSANGYLLDQFLNTSSNQRPDEFGGSVVNRARFTLSVVDAVIARIGADRVGVRLSPLGTFNSMGMDDPLAMFNYLATALDTRALAYLHVISPRTQINADDAEQGALANQLLSDIRAHYRGVLVLAGGFTRATAEQALEAGEADLFAFGKPFLANPDLPVRLRNDATLNLPNPQTFYGGDALGYTDYPFLAA